MDRPLLTFHHFGLAVRRPDKAFQYLKSLGYLEGNEAYDPLQAVNVAMRHHPTMPDVEVVWPGEAPSPIDNIVKGGRPLIYHLCYASDNAAEAIGHLRSAGLVVVEVSAPKPAILFGGLMVSFYNVLGWGLIEIVHRPPSGTD